MQTEKRVESWRVTLIVLLTLVSGATRSTGQSSSGKPGPAIPAVAPAIPAIDPAIPAIDRSWPDVNLNVLVLDKQGVPKKVDEREFHLFEDGSERPLQVRGAPDSPVSLALLIDSSGSIFKRKDAVLAAVKTIVKGMPEGSEVAAVLFSSIAYLDLPYTDVSKVDFSFLNRLQPSGLTALYGAVVSTETYIVSTAKYPRRALVILTDGEDNASQPSRGAAIWKMRQPDAPVVYSCLVSKANIFQSDLMVGHINMGFIAKWSGGPEFNLDPDPESAARQIVDAIRNQYVLQFTAAEPAHDGKEHKLALRLPSKDLKIHVLPVYFAPAK